MTPQRLILPACEPACPVTVCLPETGPLLLHAPTPRHLAVGAHKHPRQFFPLLRVVPWQVGCKRACG